MQPYAIVQACGTQFWVEEGRYYDFDKLPLNQGDTLTLNNILLVKYYNLETLTAHVNIGKPFLKEGFQIEATILRHLSGRKTRVYKMRPKKKTRKTFGSRPKFTRILIQAIKTKQSVSTAYFM
jgi:large subunit ribosomal protein L21